VAAKKQARTATRHRKKATRTTAARKVNRATKARVSERAVTRHLIVGIGASAGGLEAFTQLLRHLPADTGMAFVLVQHLDPNRESALTDLLSRVTSLPVREVTEDLPARSRLCHSPQQQSHHCERRFETSAAPTDRRGASIH
jgi:chemotaxis response regulator CheB